MSENQVINAKLIAMSELISKNIDRIKQEKMEVHPSLVRLKELEMQRWISKAETMVEVMQLLEKDLQ